MKIEIYINNQKLTTDIKTGITVQDLIYNVKQYIKDDKKEYILVDSNYKLLQDKDTIQPSLINKNLIPKYYLIESTIKLYPKENTNDIDIGVKDKIENLIMKTTGAKKPLVIKDNAPPQPGRGLFEFINNGNLGQGGADGFERLLNIVQFLEENNMIGGGIRGPIIGNNPVEANEQYLRELQEMGFPEDRARQALINSRNNINRATEILLGDVGEDN